MCIRDSINDADKTPIQVEISKERFRELQLVKGDEVFIKPRRLDLFPKQQNSAIDTVHAQ